MRFSVDQPIDVPRAVAERALVDPDFYKSMEHMGAIGAPEILRHEERADSIELAVHYRFTGNLARPARAVLDPDKLTWVIESTFHPAQHRAEFQMVPDHYADRLQCGGLYLFEERGPDRCAQIIQGELRVHAPLVAPAVERAIVMGLRQHMTEHASSVARWAASNQDT